MSLLSSFVHCTTFRSRATAFFNCGWLENPGHGVLVQLKILLKNTGLPDVRFHDLRHSAAILLLSKGVHPKVVQEILGHSEISMTMDIYSHILPAMQREAMDRLNQEFSIEERDIVEEGDGKGGDEEDDEGGSAVPASA